MELMARLSNVDLQVIADEVLASMLSDVGAVGIVARSGRDHDGEPAIMVRVDMPSGSSIIPPRLLGDARVAFWSALDRLGDDRLAYVSVNWPEEEAPASPDVPT